MKILFDARHIQNIYSGLGRFTYSILIALLEEKNDHVVTILLDQNVDYSTNPLFENITKNTQNDKIVFIDAPLYGLKHHINTSLYVNQSDCDIYFYPHFDAPLFCKKQTKFVVHDLLPLVVENYIIKHKLLKKLFFKYMIVLNLLKKTTHAITDSKSTKGDMIKYMGQKFAQKIEVVYLARSNIDITTNQKNNSLDYLIKPFLLYIGDRRPHKNLKTMIDVFKVLQEAHHYEGAFVIAGSEKNYDIDIEKYCEDTPKVLLVGQISDEELARLYQNMEALFFITKYEGFGLPILEAAQYNKKIITSNNSSLQEISPQNALLLNPEGVVSDLADRIHQYLEKNIAINNDDYLKEFSWNKSVKKIFGI